MAPNKQEKNQGIISYITFVGMIIAYFMNKDNKSAYVTYHIKTMFGLILILFISQVSYVYINIILGDILWLFSFVLWVIAFVSAIMGKLPVFPLLSEKFQSWFKFLD